VSAIYAEVVVRDEISSEFITNIETTRDTIDSAATAFKDAL
jgi:hypothetical protein